MPDDRTTRAKRALELHELATPGPMQVELGYLTCCDGPERVVVSAPARDSADGLSGYCVASFGTDDAALCDAQLFAESRTLLPQLARDVIELEAECEVLRQQRDYDYRNALDGFAGLHEDIDWLESVIVAGREMYERACAERDEKIDSYGRFGDSFNDGIEKAAEVAEREARAIPKAGDRG